MISSVNFSLTQLQYVMAVHKHRHFGRAAAECHVTQPTLSMQIQKLEADLGVVIFDRSKKPILLTDRGQRLVDQIQSILFEARKMEGLIQKTDSGTIQGRLVLGVIPTIAPYVLPRLLPVLQKKYPQLELTIREMQTHRIIDALNLDEIDVGLLATPLKISKIFEYPLFYEPFSVLCKKGHELSTFKKIKYHLLNQLKENDVWLLEEGHCLRHQMVDVCDLKRRNKTKRPFEFESGSLETLKKLVQYFGGFTLLPALAAEQIETSTQLIPFERPIPARQIGLVYLREHFKLNLIEALGEGILISIPEPIRNLRKADLEVIPVA